MKQVTKARVSPQQLAEFCDRFTRVKGVLFLITPEDDLRRQFSKVQGRKIGTLLAEFGPKATLYQVFEKLAPILTKASPKDCTLYDKAEKALKAWAKAHKNELRSSPFANFFHMLDKSFNDGLNRIKKKAKKK